jgi:hypothetical protein
MKRSKANAVKAKKRRAAAAERSRKTIVRRAKQVEAAMDLPANREKTTLKDFFRQMAVQYRQLAEIAGNPEIKQRMLDMAAHYQAKANEHSDGEAIGAGGGADAGDGVTHGN